jgi:hypothetical protein
VDVCSVYIATAIIKTSFEQIYHLLVKVSKDQQRVIALYETLSKYVRVISRVAIWDTDGSLIPNLCYTIYVLLDSSSSESNIANDNNDILRTQWGELEY